MKASFSKYSLNFKRPASTSRGVYTMRDVWFLSLTEGSKTGVGECAPLSGLSRETPEQVVGLLKDICSNPQKFIEQPDLLQDAPSVRFALETALLDLQNGGKKILFPSPFTEGKETIIINGLIWMSSFEEQKKQVVEKLESGFSCIKLKIGSLNFEEELKIIEFIREQKPDITIRVDANGAFLPEEALSKLKHLSQYHIHSIEQPIATGNYGCLAQLCAESPIPVALDEELIGINSRHQKEELLDKVHPQFIVLKPSLHGGIQGCNEWIELAKERSTGWWITSYLESNIGLNAIAQWAYTKNVKIPQGLGTGGLFTNNTESYLELTGEKLWNIVT